MSKKNCNFATLFVRAGQVFLQVYNVRAAGEHDHYKITLACGRLPGISFLETSTFAYKLMQKCKPNTEILFYAEVQPIVQI